MATYISSIQLLPVQVLDFDQASFIVQEASSMNETSFTEKCTTRIVFQSSNFAALKAILAKNGCKVLFINSKASQLSVSTTTIICCKIVLEVRNRASSEPLEWYTALYLAKGLPFTTKGFWHGYHKKNNESRDFHQMIFLYIYKSFLNSLDSRFWQLIKWKLRLNWFIVYSMPEKLERKSLIFSSCRRAYKLL